MAASFHFDLDLPFEPSRAEEILSSVPAAPGVFALRGFNPSDEPYLTRTADLRRRMRRLLAPPESQSKRLNLRDRVARIDYTVTGSDFESSLVLYQAAAAIFGYPEARRRLKLHTPYFLRFTAENPHPRVYATNRLSKRGLAQMYGPFPSRIAAERYCDAVLDLFKLRRCYEDLQPHPEHPGCVYQEMKKCLAPCNLACSPSEYAAEAEAVKAFFDTRGESLLSAIASGREAAAEAMEFEQAAALHERYQKIKAASAWPTNSSSPSRHCVRRSCKKPLPGTPSTLEISRRQRSSFSTAAASSAQPGFPRLACAPSRSRPALAAPSSPSR